MADQFKLKGTVGPHNDVNPRDSRKVKQALMQLGHLDSDEVESLEFVDRPTLTALKTFQERSGLEADGIAKPGGPTEDMIAEALVDSGRSRFGQPRKASRREPADLPSEAFLDEWRKRGFGGPRGQLNVPTLRNSPKRIESILENRPAHFNIKDNPNADETSPPHESENAGKAALASFGKLIEREARAQDVDVNLIKAIVYSENARGHYFGAARAAEGFGLAKSLLPMNIRPEIWRSLDPKEGDLADPKANIRAGVTLIKRIVDRVDKPSPEKVATLWNSMSKEKTTDFGAYVGRVYRERPWEE